MVPNSIWVFRAPLKLQAKQADTLLVEAGYVDLVPCEQPQEHPQIWGQQPNFQKHLWWWGYLIHKSSKATPSLRLHAGFISAHGASAAGLFSCLVLGQMTPLAVPLAIPHLLTPVPLPLLTPRAEEGSS